MTGGVRHAADVAFDDKSALPAPDQKLLWVVERQGSAGRHRSRSIQFPCVKSFCRVTVF